MDDPGGRSSAGGSSAGAVAVPIEAAAPAAAAPPAAGARTAWTRVLARVTRAGAAARALVANAAARPARIRLTLRLAWAAALFLLGCAAAGLAFFAMILPAADDSSHHLGKAACAPPTDAEVAYLRTASEYLLLVASAQVLAATMGLLVPARPVAVFGWLLGSLTACRATVVLWMLVASCNGSVHGALAFHLALLRRVVGGDFRRRRHVLHLLSDVRSCHPGLQVVARIDRALHKNNVTC